MPCSALIEPPISITMSWTIRFTSCQWSRKACRSIFGDGNHAWSFGPAFRWNIFDGGRVRNNILAQDARTNQLLSDYENTVLLALEDVENSMVAFEQEKIRRDALERSVIAAQESVRLVKELYIAGLTDFPPRTGGEGW